MELKKLNNMKRITAILILLYLNTGIKAQNATQGKDGNFYALTTSSKDAGKETGKTFTDREGKKYPVLETSKGKLFYLRTSKKTNTEYRAYIKTETK